MPEAPYVLTKEQRGFFLDTLKKLKLPSHYSGSLHAKISKGKLSGLKSHDFHVLLQDLMPLCMRNCDCGHMTAVVIRVSRLFKKICAKKVDMAEREALFEECAETLCVLEKQLPPSFFDIMVHLYIHLVEELFICGPVHVRWMYPFERYYKTLKGYVRNHAKPEGCMAKRYEVEEACGFASEYLGDGQSTVKRVWDNEEDPVMNDIVLEGPGKERILDQALLEEIHDFVIDNVDIVEPYREYDPLTPNCTNALSKFFTDIHDCDIAVLCDKTYVFLTVVILICAESTNRWWKREYGIGRDGGPGTLDVKDIGLQTFPQVWLSYHLLGSGCALGSSPRNLMA